MKLSLLPLLVIVACGPSPKPYVAPTQPPPAAAFVPACDDTQAAISRAADERAAPRGIATHLTEEFPDLRVSWLMKEEHYQKYIVAPAATRWGRCDDAGCFLFAAPAVVIEASVARSMLDAPQHDAATLGLALGLPSSNLEGPLRKMTLDLATAGACVRLPVDEDPGVWKCETPESTDCFKFGGFTSGGVPEVMVIDAPVAATTVDIIP